MNNVNLFLCDSAQVYDGKLSVLGAGWTWIRAGIPYTVAAIVEIPWDMTNTKVKGKFSLVNEDGVSVNPDGINPLQIEVEMEVGRPAGMKPGTSQRIPLFINVMPMDQNYAALGRYTWNLEIVGEISSVAFDFMA